MLRSLKSLGGNRVDGDTEIGVCLHRAMAVAAVPPPGRGAPAVHVLELPTEADDQARTLTRAVSDLGAKGCRANVTLPLGNYHMAQIERPPVDPGELIDAVRWRIKGQLDYPVEDAVIQVFDVPHSETQRVPLIHVVAAPNRTIRELTALVKRAGLVPSKVTIVELAVRDLASRMTERAG
jgi:MSHA biogenesis protein MshI